MRRIPAVAVVFACIAAFRTALIGRGAMAFLDETMYYKATLALDALRRADVAGALNHIASNNGRPAVALLELAPAALQGIPFALGVPPSNPRSLIIPVAMNAAVTMVTLYFFWRISLRLLDGNSAASAFAVAVYGLLVNSNVYVRHLLAIEPALCIGMAALWLALWAESPAKCVRLAVAAGMLAAFSVAVYPGYFLFALVALTMLVVVDSSSGFAERAQRLLASAAGAASVILVIAWLCRLGGVSYFATVRDLGRTISQGSFDEGWAFVPRYLVQVERAIGVVLLAGLAIFLVDLARRSLTRLTPSRSESDTSDTLVRPVEWLVLAALAAWGCQAAASSLTQSMVLYGRLIHPWMPFLVWATIDTIARIPSTAVRRTLYGVTAAASAWSFVTFAPAYFRLTYPADALYALGINSALIPPAERRCDLEFGYGYESPAPLNRRTGAPYSTRADYRLVNFCMGAPRPTPPPPEDAPPNMRLRFDAPHFMTFRAYAFEGLTPDQRDAMRRRGYDLRVYESDAVQ